MGGFNTRSSNAMGESGGEVWQGQAPWLQQMYAQASQATNGVNADPQTYAQFQNMTQGAGAGLNQWADPNNPAVQAQLGALNNQLTNTFNNDLMPAIGSAAASAGQFGGGRQGVAMGEAAGQIANAQQQGAASIMGNAYNQAQQASQFNAGFDLQQAQQLMQGQEMNMMQQMQPYMQLAQILGAPVGFNTSNNYQRGSGGGMNILSMG